LQFNQQPEILWIGQSQRRLYRWEVWHICPLEVLDFSLLGTIIYFRIHKPLPSDEKIRRNENEIKGDSGGYNERIMKDIDIDYCDIDVVYNITTEEFRNKYFKYRIPGKFSNML